MAIYGVGAYYRSYDVSQDFVTNNLVGVGWSSQEAPELQEYFKLLKVGDIVYIKAAFGRSDIKIKGIGIIKDHIIRNRQDTNNLVETGRNVIWLNTEHFVIPFPIEKLNVRLNTVYEEFHPIVQNEIITKISQQIVA